MGIMSGVVKYLLTGGGTGGHVAPALAIAGELAGRDPAARFLYVGVKGKSEETMVPKAGIRMAFVRSMGYPGGADLVALVKFACVLLLGIVGAMRVLLAYRPNVIIATGGYVSAPVLFATALLRKLKVLHPKIFLHEQNVHLGRLNALGVRFADVVGVSFPETLAHVPPEKGVLVGYPVRRNTLVTGRAEALKRLGLPANARVVFAFGGSQGARTINRAIVDALPVLLRPADVHVLHATGKPGRGGGYDGPKDVATRLEKMGELPAAKERYHRFDFIHDMGTFYSAADIVVCRAGAGTLTEVCAAGLPAVIIPKANLPGDHQVVNARVLEREGAARVLYEGVDIAAGAAEESVSGPELACLVLDLLDNSDLRRSMGEKARARFDARVLARIGGWIDWLAAGGPKPAIDNERDGERTLPPPERVLGLGSNELDHLLRRLKQSREAPLTDEEARLVRYKVDGYLASPDHIQRARGCRMVGLAGLADRLHVLVRFATQRNGRGGYVQTAFVRRDAFAGLGGLGLVNGELVEALAKGLADPYFEARAAAAGAIAELSREKGPDLFQRLCPTLLALVTDRRSFEARIAAIKALAEVGCEAERLLATFRKVYYDPVWKVREALFQALVTLIEREVITADVGKMEMGRVLITSNGYEAYYPVKGAYNRLRKRVSNGAGRA
jgi:UDP-N-acetylglucosamine--N-acetylmuramyl-(pentapeptide) pyrophosphoryl-undecaprenol N-acetylglucosamine transferase